MNVAAAWRRVFALLGALVVVGCAVAINEPAARPFEASVFEAGTGTYVRVVDVGQALCVVVATRDRRHLVYDAGGEERRCLGAIREIVGDGSIDLLVISHSDGAHMQDVPALLDEFSVREIWWPANRRPELSFRQVRGAIAGAERAGTRVRTLREDALVPGTRFSLGAASVTFVAGGSLWAGSEALDEEGQARALSLVVRLEYGESSLLLTGDTLGRLASWPDDQCGFAEAEMARRNPALLRADILVAPNHGANNASSRCLIAAVQPGWVIFPAGHAGNRPTVATVQRYREAGLTDEHLFRTDRGDDEGEGEWPYLRSAGCRDQPGDDSVEVLMPERGASVVRYLRRNDVCVVVR